MKLITIRPTQCTLYSLAGPHDTMMTYIEKVAGLKVKVSQFHSEGNDRGKGMF